MPGEASGGQEFSGFATAARAGGVQPVEEQAAVLAPDLSQPRGRPVEPLPAVGLERPAALDRRELSEVADQPDAKRLDDVPVPIRLLDAAVDEVELVGFEHRALVDR